MAVVRSERLLLLLVLTWPLLLVPVWGRTQDDDIQFKDSSDKQGLHTQHQMMFPDDSSDFNAATSSDVYNPLADHGFQVEFTDVSPSHWDDSYGRGFNTPSTVGGGSNDHEFDTASTLWEDGDDGKLDTFTTSWEDGDDGKLDTFTTSWEDGDDGKLVDTSTTSWEDGVGGKFDTSTTSWEDGDDGKFEASPTIWEDGDTGKLSPTNLAGSNDGKFDTSPTKWDGDDGNFEAPTTNWDGGDGGDVFDGSLLRSWTGSTSPSSSGLHVVCSELGFQITLLSGSLDQVKVVGTETLQSVKDAPASCGYEVSDQQNTFTVPFTGCNVNVTGIYSLQLLYANYFSQPQTATVSCEKRSKSGPDLRPRTSGQPKKCNKPTPAANCAVVSAEQLPCGYSGIPTIECQRLGCCMASGSCYYPLDECTADQHFIIAIRSNSAAIPLNPRRLIIPGFPNCKPVIVNDYVAIFKFKVTECGTRAYQVGVTKIYLAEVQTIVSAMNLRFGIITRSDPLRFMIECRYGKTGVSMASAGFMVKTPTSIIPSSVTANGLYGVQLKLAKDATYKSYWPKDSLPLQVLLGQPVYIELLLRSRTPKGMVILVNYCLAYPRSAKNALVLIYEGCPNPHDSTVAILKLSNPPLNRYVRRFKTDAFIFMNQRTNKYLNEEIYFMCSTEVCNPIEKACAQRCFD